MPRVRLRVSITPHRSKPSTQDFGVAAAAEPVAGSGELGTHLALVVDLAVEDDDPTLTRRLHRLMARGSKILDSQSSEPEGDAGFGVNRIAEVIRPAVNHRIGHGRQPSLVLLGTVCRDGSMMPVIPHMASLSASQPRRSCTSANVSNEVVDMSADHRALARIRARIASDRRFRGRFDDQGRRPTVAIASARATGSCGGTSIPVTPSMTESIAPVAVVVITGNPADPASSTTFGKPSRCVGNTSTSKAW